MRKMLLIGALLLAVNASAGYQMIWNAPGYYTVVSPVPQTYCSLNTGLVADWEFEGGVADWGPYGNHLAMVGTVPFSTQTAGVIGQYSAGPFSTSNGFIFPSLILAGRSTWSALIKVNIVSGSSGQYIYEFHDFANRFSLGYLANGQLEWFYGGTKYRTTPISIGKHAIEIVCAGANASLYIDASPAISVTDAVAIPATLLTPGIGWYYQSAAPWLGSIAYVKFYSSALTPSEIAADYASTLDKNTTLAHWRRRR